MSLKQAEEFLKKVGHRKKVSKFEKYREDIVYLYNESATLEIITQYLETKGITRTKGYNALSSYIKRNLTDDIIDNKKNFPINATKDKTQSSGITQQKISSGNLSKEEEKRRRHTSSPGTRITHSDS